MCAETKSVAAVSYQNLLVVVVVLMAHCQVGSAVATSAVYILQVHMSLYAWSGARRLERFLRIIWKKASHNSCLEFNFVQKSQRMHMSISPIRGARGLQRSVCLKSYYVQKWEIRFTLWLNAAKNMHYMKKKLRMKVVQNWISYKKVRERIYLSPPRVELGAPMISVFEIL